MAAALLVSIPAGRRARAPQAAASLALPPAGTTGQDDGSSHAAVPLLVCWISLHRCRRASLASSGCQRLEGVGGLKQRRTKSAAFSASTSTRRRLRLTDAAEFAHLGSSGPRPHTLHGLGSTCTRTRTCTCHMSHAHAHAHAHARGAARCTTGDRTAPLAPLMEPIRWSGAWQPSASVRGPCATAPPRNSIRPVQPRQCTQRPDRAPCAPRLYGLLPGWVVFPQPCSYTSSRW